jgi:hypothetical protein
MTFARTWIKVPFMRFGRRITDKDGPTTTASTRALASGPEQPACHGPLMFNETSTLENARGGSAPPSESRTALDPPRSQLPALASNVTADGPAALPLMPPVLSPPPSRLLQGRVPRTGPYTPHCMAAAVEGCALTAGRSLVATRHTVAHLMSKS